MLVNEYKIMSLLEGREKGRPQEVAMSQVSQMSANGLSQMQQTVQ